MIVIRHSDGGWSASNESSIVYKRYPVVVDGKTTGFSKRKECHISGLYIVSGEFKGKCNLAIKDDVTGEVKGFKGNIFSTERIMIECEHNTEWLKTIK